MSCSDGIPLIAQIAKAEHEIEIKYRRFELLKRKLVKEELPEDQKKAIEKELEEVAKLLNTSKKQLAYLRAYSQSFLFVIALLFIIFMVYMFYIMVAGSEF